MRLWSRAIGHLADQLVRADVLLGTRAVSRDPSLAPSPLPLTVSSRPSSNATVGS